MAYSTWTNSSLEDIIVVLKAQAEVRQYIGKTKIDSGSHFAKSKE